MMKKRNIALFAAGGLLALLVLAAAALLLFVDVNAYKSRLEAVASDALGMDVRIGGRLGIGFFPDLHVRLDDVHIRKPEVDKVSTIRSLAGPVLKLFDKTRKYLSGGQCEVFYAGSVAPPK